MTWEQPQLPGVDWDAMGSDQYVVEIRKGPIHNEQTLRSHTATSVSEAENLIEGIRDAYGNRNEVTWQSTEVDAKGNLYGLDAEGMVWVINVTPALTEALQ